MSYEKDGNPLIVSPAKAGVHSLHAWIPAFAGMTGWVDIFIIMTGTMRPKPENEKALSLPRKRESTVCTHGFPPSRE